MSLFTQLQTEQRIANCQAQIVRRENPQPAIDFKPVVKLHARRAMHVAAHRLKRQAPF
jgi:hypothetical protein